MAMIRHEIFIAMAYFKANDEWGPVGMALSAKQAHEVCDRTREIVELTLSIAPEAQRREGVALLDSIRVVSGTLFIDEDDLRDS